MTRIFQGTPICGILCLHLLLQGGMGFNLNAQSRVFETKHNLSAVGPGTIKATTEGAVCSFCHTPHSPRESVQLWNHRLSTATYELYNSDYLKSLNYATPIQPNQHSKFCLSCHDGTVAVGAVYNNRGSTTIQMANDVSTIPAASPADLGTSLRDDHPVGYIYDNTRDPELVNRNWPWGGSVKLDPDVSNGTVECQTCHDPHDNTNSKFLRMPNINAALCTYCHNEASWSDAIHKTSTQAYTTQPDSTHTTVGEWACRDCHKAHNGEGIPYLLNKVEENTCFASGCHGSTATGVNTKDIQSEFEKSYRHPTTDVTGKHVNPDNQTSLNAPNRHAECVDCHNSHQTKKGLHTAQSNAVSNVLLGTRGVTPDGAPEWTQPTSFIDNPMALEENQICFKCHSYNAFGFAPNGVTNIHLLQSNVYITDQAMEFNPANHSAHPVRVGSSDQTGSPAPKALASQQVTTAWNAVGTQTMYCSDCHGNEQQESATVPQGPHGSNAKFMLTGQGKYWPANMSGQLWSLDDIRNGRNNWQNDLFCVNCHPMFDGIQFTDNVHNATQHQGADVRCITCHVTVPHGSKRSRLIGYASDVQPYNYSGVGTYDKLVITGFQKAADPSSYQKSSCSMDNVCHGTQIGVYEQ